MIPHFCQFLLVLFNGCNNTAPIFPQLTNNSNGSYQIPATGCNCSCTNYPNFLNLCQLPNVTIPPCATTVSDTPKLTSLLPTTPGITTLITEEDDDVFNDQARKKKTTTKMPSTLVSTITRNPITSTVKSVSELISDSQMPSNPPNSSNLQKDKLSTQITSDVRDTSTTPSSSDSFAGDVSPSETTPTPVIPELTDTTIISKTSTTSYLTTSIDRSLSTENVSTSRSSRGTTTSLDEHISSSDQSFTSPSISTTQSSTSTKTVKSSTSGSTIPAYGSSKVPEENTPTEEDSDNNNLLLTTTIDYVSSTQKPDEEKVTTLLSTMTESLTTLSPDNQSSPSPADTTGSSTQSEKKDDKSTTVKYDTTDVSTSTTQYDQPSTDSTVNDDVTTEDNLRNSSLPTMTTEENEEIFNDKASKKKKTTTTQTTPEPTESSSISYLTSRATSELASESPDTIPTTWSTTELVSTTQSTNDSNCDLTDQPTDKSIDPMNNTELTSLTRIKRSLFNYGIGLSNILLQNDTSNVAISPINFALLLAMVRSGCRSPLKEEFDKVLNLSFDTTDNRLKIFKSIVDSMNNITENESVEVHMANKMYLPNHVDVNPRFSKLTKIIFGSEPQTIDFRDAISTAQQLNNWSTNRTNDKIPVFTDSNHLDPSSSVLLTSVAYFSGNWSNPFDRQFTSKNSFYYDDGTEKKLCTMIQVNKFRYGKLPDLKAEFVELPFESSKSNPLSMIVMLPKNGTNLNQVAERLRELAYSQLTANSSIEVVELSLPKFRIESVIDFAEHSQEFGLANVTSLSYDFKCIVEAKPLKISHIIQKTIIEIHEGGCFKVPRNYVCPKEEQNCRTTSSIKFTVNQPFIVLVVNSDIILFSGRVNDPSIKSVNTRV